jgi:hypothetical protein
MSAEDESPRAVLQRIAERVKASLRDVNGLRNADMEGIAALLSVAYGAIRDAIKKVDGKSTRE